MQAKPTINLADMEQYVREMYDEPENDDIEANESFDDEDQIEMWPMGLSAPSFGTL